jgi:transposase-like protein
MDEKKELAEALDTYIKEKHTQEECVGFIAGFEKALSQINKNVLLGDVRKV